MSPDLQVNRNLTIPESELELRFSPSGGPGGQHANRSSTRAEVTWNIDASSVLSSRQRRLLREKLRHRIDSGGELRVASDTHRSQLRNREEAVARLGQLVADALQPRVRRIPTAPTRAARQRRLDAKRRQSQKKRDRRATPDD